MFANVKGPLRLPADHWETGHYSFAGLCPIASCKTGRRARRADKDKQIVFNNPQRCDSSRTLFIL